MMRRIATVMALALITLAGSACASLPGSPGYCTAGTRSACMGLEGNGDCQPCPATGSGLAPRG